MGKLPVKPTLPFSFLLPFLREINFLVLNSRPHFGSALPAKGTIQKITKVIIFENVAIHFKVYFHMMQVINRMVYRIYLVFSMGVYHSILPQICKSVFWNSAKGFSQLKQSQKTKSVLRQI